MDFSQSTISNVADQAKVKGIFSDLASWGTKPNSLTPIGIDILKRRIADYYAESSQARSFVSNVHGKVKSELDKIPGYKDMTLDYEVATNMIKEFESELSIGKNKTPGTALRKVMNAFNDNSEYKRSLIEALSTYSGGKNIVDEIAGVQASSLVPRGVIRPLMAGGAISALSGGPINPQFFLTMAATSPRIVGESARLTGKTVRLGKLIGQKTRAKKLLLPVSYRTGKYGLQANEDNQK